MAFRKLDLLPSVLLHEFALECALHCLREAHDFEPFPDEARVREAVELKRAWLADAVSEAGLLAARDEPVDQVCSRELRHAVLELDAIRCVEATAKAASTLFGQRAFEKEGGGKYGIDCAMGAASSEDRWQHKRLSQLRKTLKSSR